MTLTINNPHLLETDELIQQLQTRTETGLSKHEADKRQSEVGPNELIENRSIFHMESRCF